MSEPIERATENAHRAEESYYTQHAEVFAILAVFWELRRLCDLLERQAGKP